MDKKQLKSIGISDTEAELMLKVRKTLNGKSTDDMEEVYRICAKSGNFTDEELGILKGVKKNNSPSIVDVIIRVLKAIFGK